MKAYKAGLPIPEDDTTEAASKQLQQSVHLATEEASSDESDEEEVEEEQEEASPEPVKEPTPPRSNKRRRTTGEARNAVVPSPAPPKKASPCVLIDLRSFKGMNWVGLCSSYAVLHSPAFNVMAFAIDY